MKRTQKNLLLAGLATAVVLSGLLIPRAVNAADATLIRARRVYTMTGPPRENVEVLVRDGRIVGIGERVVPLGTYQVLEVDTLMPGLVDAYSSAGLRGGDSESTREVTPEFETATTIDWHSRDFAEAVRQGITAVHIMPGTDNVISGLACVAKTAGTDLSLEADNRRLVKPQSGLALAVCTDPTGGNRSRTRPDSIYVRQPTNRMGVVWIIRARMQDARTPDDEDDTSQRLSKVLEGELPVFGVSRTAFDIETLFTLGDEFGFAPVLFGGHEAYRKVDLLAERNTPVVYSAPLAGTTRGRERTDLFWNTPGMLDAAGVAVSLGGGDLLERARFAHRNGMPAESALAAITSRPAELLGVGERIGRISADCDADLIALDGPPLEFTSSLRWVMVDGQLLDLENGE
jgi:imidazolonepropionase-like amidohydrolase